MRKRVLVVLLVISAGFNIGVLATFGHHWLFRITPESWHAKKMQRELGLYNEQAAAMRKDRAEMKKIIEPLREGLQKKRSELFAALGETNVDKVKLDKLVSEISSLQMDLERTLIDRSIDFRKNLTPEQQQKFAKVLLKKPKRMAFGGGMGYGAPEMMRDKCERNEKK